MAEAEVRASAADACYGPAAPATSENVARTILPKIVAADNAVAAATKRIQQLEAELAVLHPLTSGTDLADAAAAAVTAAGRRAATIAALVDSARNARHVPRGEADDHLNASRSTLTATASLYRSTALRVLGRGAADDLTAVLPASS